MLYIREWRSRLALVWLLCQVASMALAAVSLPHTAIAAAVTTCTCPGDHPDQACPMHQSGNGANNEGDDCSVRSALAPTDAALLSLGTGLGIPAAVSIAIGPASARPIDVVAVAAAGVTDVPDSPPPRV